MWARLVDRFRRLARWCGSRLRPLGQRVAGNAVVRSIGRRLADNPQRALALALLGITIACRFVPLSPAMPGAGLDESWTLGMNQAIAQGLVFGRDIVFTFGPYASIFTGAYHPSTDGLMLFGSAYLAVTYWIAIVSLTRGARPYLPWCLLVMTVCLLTSRDALLMSYPLIIGLACCKARVQSAERSPRFVLVVFSSFGLLPLIKGSMVPVCGLVAAVIVAQLAFERHRRLALGVIASPMVAMAAFWIIAGQPLLALPAYVRALFSFISGYAEAMGGPGDITEIICYLIGSAILLAGVVWETTTPSRTKKFLFAIYAAFLFVAFKAGFVRHDAHAVISGTSLLIAGVVFAGTLESKLRIGVIVSSILGWMYIDSHYTRSSTESVIANALDLYSTTWDGLDQRLTTDWPRDRFEAVLRGVKQRHGLPALDGTSDVYSYDQTILVASGNRWNPRPIIQSYAVYNGFLAEHNRAHLLGSTAPDNIFFKVAPIDGRLPALEDATSWPVLLALYRPVALEHGFLRLRRRTSGSALPELATLETAIHSLATPVPVPGADSFVMAEIRVEPSLLGRAAGLLFKPNQLTITLTFENGATRSYRYISSMGKLGLMISPLVENTLEFASLYGGTSFLEAKKVASFSIEPDGSAIWWRPRYKVVFKTMKLRPVDDPRRFYELAEQLTGATEIALEPARCEGYVDVINGIAQPPRALTARGLLEVSGWTARSIKDARLPEAVLLVLTDQRGRHTLWNMRHVKRRDVGAHYKDPRLDASGYTAAVDISKLAGAYDLELALQDGDRIELCPEFKYYVTVKPVTAE